MSGLLLSTREAVARLTREEAQSVCRAALPGAGEKPGPFAAPPSPEREGSRGPFAAPLCPEQEGHRGPFVRVAPSSAGGRIAPPSMGTGNRRSIAPQWGRRRAEFAGPCDRKSAREKGASRAMTHHKSLQQHDRLVHKSGDDGEHNHAGHHQVKLKDLAAVDD